MKKYFRIPAQMVSAKTIFLPSSMARLLAAACLLLLVTLAHATEGEDEFSIAAVPAAVEPSSPVSITEEAVREREGPLS